MQDAVPSCLGFLDASNEIQCGLAVCHLQRCIVSSSGPKCRIVERFWSQQAFEIADSAMAQTFVCVCVLPNGSKDMCWLLQLKAGFSLKIKAKRGSEKLGSSEESGLVPTLLLNWLNVVLWD